MKLPTTSSTIARIPPIAALRWLSHEAMQRPPLRGSFVSTRTMGGTADGSRSAARRHVLAGPCLRQRRLGGREPRERHAERRAGDVVETDLLAERDRLRVASVLPADAELDPVLHAAPTLDGDPHEVADAGRIQRLERVALEDPVLQVLRQEL